MRHFLCLIQELRIGLTLQGGIVKIEHRLLRIIYAILKTQYRFLKLQTKIFWDKERLLFYDHLPYFCAPFNADVAKLADAPDLGSGAARHVGSIPIIRTGKPKPLHVRGFFKFFKRFINK